MKSYLLVKHKIGGANLYKILHPQVGTKTTIKFREGVKYYFADFVRKGGGGYPPNP